MNAWERGIEAPPVDAHLALPLDEVHVRGAGLPPPVAEGAALGVDALRAAHHREGIHVAPVGGHRGGDLRRHQRRVDAVEALQDLDDLVVLGGPHRLADHDAVLWQRPPRDARGLRGGQRRQRLVGTQQGLQREEAVGEVRLAGEVGGGGGHDAQQVAGGGPVAVGVVVVDVERCLFFSFFFGGGGGEGVVVALDFFGEEGVEGGREGLFGELDAVRGGAVRDGRAGRCGAEEERCGG